MAERKSLKQRAFDKIPIGLKVAFLSNYDAYVDPRRYQLHVNRENNRRERLGTSVADIFQYNLPETKKNGSPQKILDIAAGTGIVSRVLVERGYQVHATDLSQEALDYLKEQSPTIATTRADMNEGLPFAENQFDGATIVWSNRYIDNPKKFLFETNRVLKVDGILVWPLFPLDSLAWKLKIGISKPTFPDSLETLAKKSGFKNARQETLLFEARGKEHQIPVLVAKK